MLHPCFAYVKVRILQFELGMAMCLYEVFVSMQVFHIFSWNLKLYCALFVAMANGQGLMTKLLALFHERYVTLQTHLVAHIAALKFWHLCGIG